MSTADRARSRRTTAQTYWLPLAVTATVATAGLAIWAWHTSSATTSLTPEDCDDSTRGSSASLSSRIARFLRWGDGATEVDDDNHKPDLDPKNPQSAERSPSSSTSPRLRLSSNLPVVAVVLSAESGHTQTRILDTISPMSRARLVILIYAPRSTTPSVPPLSGTSGSPSSPGPSGVHDTIPQQPSSDLSSSPGSTDLATLASLGSKAASLVASDEAVMTFSTASGYTHILRHLAPAKVLIDESSLALLGPEGANVRSLRGWVGRVDLCSDRHHRSHSGPTTTTLIADTLATSGGDVGVLEVNQLAAWARATS